MTATTESSFLEEPSKKHYDTLCAVIENEMVKTENDRISKWVLGSLRAVDVVLFFLYLGSQNFFRPLLGSFLLTSLFAAMLHVRLLNIEKKGMGLDVPFTETLTSFLSHPRVHPALIAGLFFTLSKDVNPVFTAALFLFVYELLFIIHGLSYNAYLVLKYTELFEDYLVPVFFSLTPDYFRTLDLPTRTRMWTSFSLTNAALLEILLEFMVLSMFKVKAKNVMLIALYSHVFYSRTSTNPFLRKLILRVFKRFSDIKDLAFGSRPSVEAEAEKKDN